MDRNDPKSNTISMGNLLPVVRTVVEINNRRLRRPL
jgi:hypothetical protein